MSDDIDVVQPCKDCTADDLCALARKECDDMWEILSEVVGMPWEQWTPTQQEKYINVRRRMYRHTMGQAVKREAARADTASRTRNDLKGMRDD